MRVAAAFLLGLVIAAAARQTEAHLLDKLKCTGCKTLGSIAMGVIRISKSSSVLQDKAQAFCPLAPVTETICHSYINRWATALTYIVLHTHLSASDICSLYLGACEPRTLKIDVTLDLPQPPGPGTAAQRDAAYPPPSTPGLTVLHFADIHLDFLYAEGADNSCPDVLCCRAENGFPADESRQAGRWGDYTRCDAPYELLYSLVQHAAKQHQGTVDYILWTGDSAAHDSWKTTRDDVLKTMRTVTELLLQFFPRVPVIPVIGNHDSAPTDNFPPPEVARDGFSVGWLYSSLADMWRPWLRGNAGANLERGGFYSKLIRPGFRIIVLNTNVAYRLNFWVVLTARQDPAGQLRWLTEELHAAQRSGEKCHVVGHVSPADPDMLPAWSHLYHSILWTYQDTVTAQFFSHTHLDEIQLFKDRKEEPFSMAYVAPSLSPWKDVNPGYKVYTVDGSRGDKSTWEVTDFARWTADLVQANTRPNIGPRWVEQYTAAAAYNLTNLSPQSWDHLVDDMLVSDKLFTEYYRHLSGGSWTQAICDPQCREDQLCNIVTSDRTDRRHCDFLRG